MRWGEMGLDGLQGVLKRAGEGYGEMTRASNNWACGGRRTSLDAGALARRHDRVCCEHNGCA